MAANRRGATKVVRQNRTQPTDVTGTAAAKLTREAQEAMLLREDQLSMATLGTPLEGTELDSGLVEEDDDIDEDAVVGDGLVRSGVAPGNEPVMQADASKEKQEVQRREDIPERLAEQLQLEADTEAAERAQDAEPDQEARALREATDVHEPVDTVVQVPRDDRRIAENEQILKAEHMANHTGQTDTTKEVVKAEGARTAHEPMVTITINTDCQPTIGIGNDYNFKAGRRYSVPRHVAEHLEEKGYVWH